VWFRRGRRVIVAPRFCHLNGRQGTTLPLIPLSEFPDPAHSGISTVIIPNRLDLDWDSFTIAENFFRRFSLERTTEPMPIRLAQAWGNEVKNKLRADMLYEQDLAATRTGSDFTSAVFAGFDNHGPLIVVGTVRYTVDSFGAIDTNFVINDIFRHPQQLMLGATDIGAEIQKKSTPRVKQWMSKIPSSTDPVVALAIHEVNFSIRYSPPVTINGKTFSAEGGPVDAVRLTPFKGIDWIQIKANCPKN
jgi:hypothetical protein